MLALGLGLGLGKVATVGDTTPGGVADALLLEDSFYLLLETGDKIPVTDSFAGLSEATTLTSGDMLYLVQSATSKRVLVSTLQGQI